MTFTDMDYLRQVEFLANRLVATAYDEGWEVLEPSADAGPVALALREIAMVLQHFHFDGDGCLDDESRLRDVAGVLVLRPEAMPPTADYTYEQVCAGLYLKPQPGGWAIWNTWTRSRKRCALVLNDPHTTEGLLLAWEHGRAIWPAEPLKGQVARVVSGWVGPMVWHPHHAERIILGPAGSGA
ncbi:hypothetical protein Cs7R123_73940 [Catellatospora sp. TT07R-123]|uniref:hypothetical protein n=1 Tax=Catellatospora sp. TT07R-123 TaxID=2733863 RepID=UPI001B1EED18|nr:hypothetical protein [Catellatospora sp. TT07R-123]GHJ50052.1 hypothetical protein Cs7R123_73940 [Catellatospora sp. TT07R-123]